MPNDPFTMQDDDSAKRVPDWVVTFGDMMALLLTFFIMLYSLSNTDEEEKYTAIFDSIRQRFGHRRSVAAVTPGRNKPRRTEYVENTNQGRSRRLDRKIGGDKLKAPSGDHKRVQVIGREGKQ